MRQGLRLAVIDVAAVAMYAPVALLVFARHTLLWAAATAIAVTGAAVVMARHRPLSALAVLAPLLWLAPEAPDLPFVTLVPVLYVLFRVASQHNWPAALVGLAAAYTGAVATALPNFAHRGAIAPFAVVFTAAWALGLVYRHRLARSHADLVRARAELAEQRLRIARELHDIVAHGMSVITVQAGYGQLIIDTDPDKAKAALDAIAATGRTALAEMRLLLGVLREGDEPITTPLPGLGDLPTLADRTCQAGVAVDLRIDDPMPEIPPGMGLSAYRIVQEALTNVVRHAHASSVLAVVTCRGTDLVVEVADNGHGGRDGVAGHGLAGMAERTGLYGGTLEAGPHREGGWRIRATMPLPAAGIAA